VQVNAWLLHEQNVFILEHYFVWKWIAADREAFSNAYPDKEVPNKKTPTGNNISGHSNYFSVTNTCRTDFKQCINCNNVLLLQEFNTAIGFVVLRVKVFMCSSSDCVLKGTFCI
jgi:hypothetical protein